MDRIETEDDVNLESCDKLKYQTTINGKDIINTYKDHIIEKGNIIICIRKLCHEEKKYFIIDRIRNVFDDDVFKLEFYYV
jgi:hypothetical protein